MTVRGDKPFLDGVVVGGVAGEIARVAEPVDGFGETGGETVARTPSGQPLNLVIGANETLHLAVLGPQTVVVTADRRRRIYLADNFPRQLA